MTACPCCFQLLPADSFRWQCDTPSCQEPDPVAQSWLGDQARIGGVVEWQRGQGTKGAAPEQVGCPVCAGPARPACPYCHFALPQGWMGSTTVTVAMAGARNTGKSVFVGVLVRFLADLVARHDSSFQWAHPRSQQLYRDPYEKALFAATDAMGGPEVEATVLETTPRAQTGTAYQRFPLIMSLGTLGRQRTFFVLRDVAGEDLEMFAGGESGDAVLTFFRHADLVVYLFDPLTVPFVSGALEGLIPRQTKMQVANPADVLDTVLQLVGGGGPLLAVVLSKFDAFQRLRDVGDTVLGRIMASPGSSLVRAPALTGAYDEQDGALVHEEVRGVLQEMEADQVVKLSTTLRHRFFAVSSLGDSPDGKRLSPHGIAPYRVLDPILWLLAEKRLIPRT